MRIPCLIAGVLFLCHSIGEKYSIPGMERNINKYWCLQLVPPLQHTHIISKQAFEYDSLNNVNNFKFVQYGKI